MDIYDSIAAALDMNPIQLDFNLIEMIQLGQIEMLSNHAIGLGPNNPMYGRKHTEESKKLMVSNRKETKKLFGEDNPMYGRKGDLHYQHGIARSDEVKRKISEANKNQVKIVCEHCGLPAIKTNYNRWHGVNCKSADYKT